MVGLKTLELRKNKHGRRKNTNLNEGDETEYYYDPKTGRRMRV